MSKDESIVHTKKYIVDTDVSIDSEALVRYKSDYSVVTLRLEMKGLGRVLRDRKDELSEQEIDAINNGIIDIKETLKLLKIKYGIYKD